MTRSIVYAILTAVLSVGAAGSPAIAQGPFYSVRADAAQADRHVGSGDNPLLIGTDTPFWTAVEPLINRYNLCTDLIGDVANPAKVLNYTRTYAQPGVEGANSALAWMEQAGFYPFDGVSFEVADPKAPDGFPIFCTMTPTDGLERKGRLRPHFFDYAFDEPLKSVYLLAEADVMWPGVDTAIGYESLGFDPEYNVSARIQLGASWTLGEVWDVSRRYKFGDGTRAPFWLTVAAVDALSVVSLEDSGVFVYGNYDDVELRLPFLQGNFSRRLTDFESPPQADASPQSPSATALNPNAAAPAQRPIEEDREDETKGAFIRFLIEDHLDDDWGHLAEILNVATNADDHMVAIHNYLDAQDGTVLQGLEHAFPAFVAKQASLGFTKYRGRVSPAVWLQDSFGDCEEVVIDEVTLKETTTLDVLPYAARCIIVWTESRHAPWHGDLQTKMRLADGQPGDDRIDDVFMSFSAFGDQEPVKAEYTCEQSMDERGDLNECVFTPTAQGAARDDKGVLQRLYYQPVGKKSLHERKWTLLLLSYVPTDERPGGVESRPGVNVEIKWSLDTVIDGGGGELADMGSSGDEFELMDMSTATIDHGSKVGLAPILTRQTENNEMSWQNIWDGMASPIPGNLLEDALAQFDNLIGFNDEAGDGFGVIITDPKVLEPGFTGTTTAYTPYGGKDGYMSMPDPDYEGHIEIIENTKDTLYFTVEESFCMVPESEIPEMIRQNREDLCEFGERVKAKATGAIAFPELRRSKTKLDPVETDVYRGLRNLRLEKIQSRFGSGIAQGGFGAQPSNTGQPSASAPNTQSQSGSTNAGSPSNVCLILKPDTSCDCSCDAKTCFDTKTLSSTLSQREAACRLTCGKRWKTCAPASP